MQHPPGAMLDNPMFNSLRAWSHGRLARGELPLEWTIRAMDEAGVRRGLLCAWWGPAGPLISNDNVAAAVARCPDRFAGVASVDLAAPMLAVRELRRCVRELGFKALRVIPWLWNLPPDDRRSYPLYAECVELGIPFCTQVGHAGLPSACAGSTSLGSTTRPWRRSCTAMPNGYSVYDRAADRWPRGATGALGKTPGRRRVIAALPRSRLVISPAPARAYIEELMPDVLDGTVEPVRVFDRPISLQWGYQLAEERKRLGFTQAGLAEIMGVSPGRVSQIEHGWRDGEVHRARQLPRPVPG